ncbi:MAG TPA: hypothetical protein VGL27_13625 [Negativicutes bacterium]
MKVIAVDIDNVLNNFSETLKNNAFAYNDSYGLSREEFDNYLDRVTRNIFNESKFLTTKFSDFRYRIHEQCYRLALAKPDGVKFIRWLKDNNWKVIICTKRDLRLTGDCTKKWLAVNNIPYDYLFMALNKIVFCNLWKVQYLIDDDISNIIYGEQYGIKVYYPMMPKHNLNFPSTAKGFTLFEEIKQWILE